MMDITVARCAPGLRCSSSTLLRAKPPKGGDAELRSYSG